MSLNQRKNDLNHKIMRGSFAEAAQIFYEISDHLDDDTFAYYFEGVLIKADNALDADSVFEKTGERFKTDNPSFTRGTVEKGVRQIDGYKRVEYMLPLAGTDRSVRKVIEDFIKAGGRDIPPRPGEQGYQKVAPSRAMTEDEILAAKPIVALP